MPFGREQWIGAEGPAARDLGRTMGTGRRLRRPVWKVCRSALGG